MGESRSLLSNLGVPASTERRSEQLREMTKRLKQQESERLTAQEMSRLSDIESRRRWDEIYAAMNLDEVIEIPGKCGGEDIMIRAIVGPGGRVMEVRSL